MTVARLSTSTKCGNVCSGCHTIMSNFAKLSSSWLVQSIREVSRRVSVSLANVLIVSPLRKNFENANHVFLEARAPLGIAGVKKHTKEKVSNSNNLLSHTFTCTLILDT